MTINQAVEFFQSLPSQKIIDNIIAKLTPLQDVGLGYLKMGQSSSTLSGGEAQRVKLAYYLSLGNNQQNTLFIFDEPTTVCTSTTSTNFTSLSTDSSRKATPFWSLSTIWS